MSLASGISWTASVSTAIEAQIQMPCAHYPLVSALVWHIQWRGYYSNEDSDCWKHLNWIAIEKCQISLNKSTIDCSVLIVDNC